MPYTLDMTDRSPEDILAKTLGRTISFIKTEIVQKEKQVRGITKTLSSEFGHGDPSISFSFQQWREARVIHDSYMQFLDLLENCRDLENVKLWLSYVDGQLARAKDNVEKSNHFLAKRFSDPGVSLELTDDETKWVMFRAELRAITTLSEKLEDLRGLV